MRRATRVLDVLLILTVAVMVAVILTGGGTVEAGRVRIRIRSIDNPFWLAFGLALIRYTLRPHLGGADFVSRLLHRASLAFRHPWKMLLAIFAVVVFLKAALAWTLPGFFSGDDVEVHEMTMGPLVGRAWPVWELRSAFFPMTFIFPAQWLAFHAGLDSPEVLVFAGRVVVAVLSTFVIPLTWLAARRLWPGDATVAVAAVVFVVFNKLLVSFGSSELPRPVATVFVAAGFLVLLRRGGAAAAFGGVLLGIAAAFRFSEAIFIVPAAAVAMWRRDWLAMVIAPIAMTLALATIVGVADFLYWGEPFSSLQTAATYTLLERESSRGHQPLYEYVVILAAWSTPIVVALAIAGSRRDGPETWWLWLPLAILTLLPHKESRYMIPVIPFLCLSAAHGLVVTINWVRTAATRSRQARWLEGLLAPMLALSLLHDAGGWRLRRSNEGVQLARYLRGLGREGVAAEHSWRLGGQAYLWRHEPVVDLPPERLASREARAAAFRHARWVALRTRTAREIGLEEMRALGFTPAPEWQGEDYVLFTRQGSL